MADTTIQGPIQRMATWHKTRVSEHKTAQELSRKEEKERLYNSTMEKFEKGFERLSSLDGSTDPLTPDTQKSPGEVEVKGVGSLRKTLSGFTMEVLSGMGPTAGFGAAGLEVSGSPHRNTDVFRVSEADNTILYLEYGINSAEVGYLKDTYLVDLNSKEMKLIAPLQGLKPTLEEF